VNTFSLFIYNLSVRLYALGIALASAVNNKAKLWIEGRQQPLPSFTKQAGEKVIWFHCASLGEFEQARPLLEKIKQQYPACKIALTFFSPSGYEVRKSYTLADIVAYLPLDTPENAKRFINYLQPDLALFVKYEFWYHHLNEMNNRQIPIVLFSSIFRPGQVFFKWYGGLHCKILSFYSRIFVQNEESAALLKTINISATIANDTRFDRVKEIADNRKQYPFVEVFKDNGKMLIAGSTWQHDEELILQCITNNVLPGYKYIIAPHDINPERIEQLLGLLKGRGVKFSDLKTEAAAQADVLIIDNIGRLAALYSYADIVYIGGGFNTSVHNVLEPAVYGVPLLFGPNHTKSAEAIELTKQKGAFVINNYPSLQNMLNLLNTNNQVHTRAADVTRLYVSKRTGGTDVIFNDIAPLIK
jgi:3-deoxy-D-manno-octulosonic-acid transferase